MVTIRDRVIELRKVRAGDLRPNPAQWRVHTPIQRQALQGVLAEIGFAGAALAYQDADGGLTLVDGHLRSSLDANAVISVIVTDLDAEEAKKLLAVYDPLSAMAGQDQDTLLALLRDVSFEDQAVNDLLEAVVNGERVPMPALYEPQPDPGPQIDRAAELQQKWGTARGQIWEIERHRLVCGDAKAAEDHEVLLAGTVIDLVLTDPPYGVGVEYGDSVQDSVQALRDVIGIFLPLLCCWPVVLLSSGQRAMWEYPKPDWVLAWIHPAPIGCGPWGFTGFNPILAYGADPYLRRGLGSRSDVLVMVANRDGEGGHPVIKPLKVWAWLLERGSPVSGQSILDPFLGSGTTMVAAEQLNRICYGMEIEPKYVAVTLERMAGMGLTPRRVDA